MELPQIFKPLLWSYEFSTFDPDKQRKTIVINTINYGDLRHWRWIAGYYGKDTVREVLERIPADALRPRARKLASLLFSIRAFNHAPRSAVGSR